MVAFLVWSTETRLNPQSAGPSAAIMMRFGKRRRRCLNPSAKNHGFADGNKRTATILLKLMLERSGYDMAPINDEILDDATESFVVSVANGEMDMEQIQAWIKSRIVAKV